MATHESNETIRKTNIAVGMSCPKCKHLELAGSVQVWRDESGTLKAELICTNCHYRFFESDAPVQPLHRSGTMTSLASIETIPGMQNFYDRHSRREHPLTPHYHLVTKPQQANPSSQETMRVNTIHPEDSIHDHRSLEHDPHLEFDLSTGRGASEELSGAEHRAEPNGTLVSPKRSMDLDSPVSSHQPTTPIIVEPTPNEQARSYSQMLTEKGRDFVSSRGAKLRRAFSQGSRGRPKSPLNGVRAALIRSAGPAMMFGTSVALGSRKGKQVMVNGIGISIARSLTPDPSSSQKLQTSEAVRSASRSFEDMIATATMVPQTQTDDPTPRLAELERLREHRRRLTYERQAQYDAMPSIAVYHAPPRLFADDNETFGERMQRNLAEAEAGPSRPRSTSSPVYMGAWILSDLLTDMHSGPLSISDDAGSDAARDSSQSNRLSVRTSGSGLYPPQPSPSAASERRLSAASAFSSTASTKVGQLDSEGSVGQLQQYQHQHQRRSFVESQSLVQVRYGSGSDVGLGVEFGDGNAGRRYA